MLLAPSSLKALSSFSPMSQSDRLTPVLAAPPFASPSDSLALLSFSTP
jgi:hypothetical protein